MTSYDAVVTTHNSTDTVNSGDHFGPRLGWGTGLGLLILSLSLIIWTNAQTIVVDLMNGGHVTEVAATATLGTLRQNAAIGSAIGAVISVRVALTALQALLLGTTLLPRTLRPGQQKADPIQSDLYRRRYITDLDPGGLTRALIRLQQLIADIPGKTAAILSKAAVFLWAALLPSLAAIGEFALEVVSLGGSVDRSFDNWADYLNGFERSNYRAGYRPRDSRCIDMADGMGTVMFGLGTTWGPANRSIKDPWRIHRTERHQAEIRLRRTDNQRYEENKKNA